jgi:hypothetical protein
MIDEKTRGLAPSALALAALVSLASSACTSEPTTPPATTEGRATSTIALRVSVRESDAYVLIDVSAVSSYLTLSLAAGERLSVGLDGASASTALEHVGDGYVAELAAHPETLTLAFGRTSEASAPATLVTLPPSFELAGPSGAVSRLSPFTVTWTPSAPGHPVDLSITGPCLSPGASFHLADDPGTFSVQPGDLFVKPDARGAACTLEVNVVRRDGGSIVYDPALAPGGAATLTQERTLRVQTTP